MRRSVPRVRNTALAEPEVGVGCRGRNYGSAWVVFEESAGSSVGVLMSIISPRRSFRFVADHVEQAFVDRYSPIHGRLAFKVSRKAASHPVEFPHRYRHIMQCGHDRVMHAIQAKALFVVDGLLVVEYMRPIYSDPPPGCRLELATRRLTIPE